MVMSPKYLQIILLASVVLIGCNQVHPAPVESVTPAIKFRSTPVATVETEPVTATTPVNTLIPEKSQSDDPVTVCDPNLQAFAMRPEAMPDWQKLPVKQCYELTLNISDDYTTYTGMERLTFLNDYANNLSDLVVRIYPNAVVMYGGKLEIGDVVVGGKIQRPKPFSPDGTAVKIELPAPLSLGMSSAIEINFSGLLPKLGSNPRAYGIFSNSDQKGPFLELANWYPMLAEYKSGDWQANPVIGTGDAVVSRTSLYKVSITAPSNLVIATTGKQIKSVQEGNVTTYDMVSGPARDFMIVAGKSLEKKVVRWNDIEIIQYGLPETEVSWSQVLDVVTTSLSIYTTRFGEYPYNELDVISAPLTNASGVEYPGLVLISKDLYVDKSRSNYLSTIGAHELAHQWWYGVVGNNVLEAPWQDEALATFSALLYFEKTSPINYQETISYYHQLVTDQENNYPGDQISDPLGHFDNRHQAYERIVYIKGSLFFVELRKKLGDDVFFKALNGYYSNNTYQNPSPDRLLAAFETACNCDLKNFYTLWAINASN